MKINRLVIAKEYHKYTMLVAWHKFDSYERHLLADITKMDISKLPFASVLTVLSAVRQVEIQQSFLLYPKPVIACREYRRRILYAVMKEHRKHHRKRLRIKT